MCDEAVGLHAIKSFVSAGGLGSRVLLQLPFYKNDLWSIVPCKCCLTFYSGIFSKAGMIMLSQILYLYFLAIIFAFFYGDNYGWALSSIMAIINVLLLYSRNIKIQRYYCRSIVKIRRGIVKLFVRDVAS